MFVSKRHLVYKLVEFLIVLPKGGEAKLIIFLELKVPSVSALHGK